MLTCLPSRWLRDKKRKKQGVPRGVCCENHPRQCSSSQELGEVREFYFACRLVSSQLVLLMESKQSDETGKRKASHSAVLE